ncbi:hypothetical protein HZB00_02995 [Candidatus Woesearchaeota archaeon]|nr:hypothetical protein [Candidatus Woesearchaeota archaeon]
MQNVKPIGTALKQLGEALLFLDVIFLTLSTTFVFLLALLFLVLFTFSWVYAFAPSFVYLGLALYFHYRRNRLLEVEQKVPVLSEALRTVADTISVESNEVLASLREDVLRQMKKIKISYFLDFTSLGLKLLSIVIVSFLVVLIAILNINFNVQFNPHIPEAIKSFTVRSASQEVPRIDLSSLEGKNMSLIFGNRSLATLGTKEVLLEIHPLQSEINLDESTTPEKKNFNPPDFPKEIYTSSESTYTEQVPKRNQQLIKSYFEQITR